MDARYVSAFKKKWYSGTNNSRSKVVVNPDDYIMDDPFAGYEDEMEAVNKVIIELTNDNGYIELPCIFDVCGLCDGKGHHVNPNVDAHGITQDEWQDWDCEEIEGYFNGRYDVVCYECGGNRVVPRIDKRHLTENQKIFVEHLEKQIKDQAQDARDQYREWQMGY